MYDAGTCKCKNCDDDCKNGAIQLCDNDTKIDIRNKEQDNIFADVESGTTNSSDFDINNTVNPINNKIRNHSIRRRIISRHTRRNLQKRNLEKRKLQY